MFLFNPPFAWLARALVFVVVRRQLLVPPTLFTLQGKLIALQTGLFGSWDVCETVENLNLQFTVRQIR